MEERVNAYVSATIAGASSCHITLATDKMATSDDIVTLRGAMEHMIAPLFPCQFRLGNFTMVGGGGQIAAYKCKPVNHEVMNALSAFYAQHYRGVPGSRLYPSLKLHITVDTGLKLDQIEAFQHAASKGVFTVEKPTLRTRRSNQGPPADPRVGELRAVCPACLQLPYHQAVECKHGEPIQIQQPPFAPASYTAPPMQQHPSAPPFAPAQKRVRQAPHPYPPVSSPQWNCRNCGWDNNISKKECRNSECNEWRPRELMPQSALRAGDWNCPACGDHQFAKNKSCRRCSTLRPAQ